MRVENIRDVKWAKEDKTELYALVDIVGGLKNIPVTVSAGYDLEYGRTLFAEAVNGDHGKVGDYTPPPPPPPTVVTPSQVKSEANRRIVSIFPDWKQRNLLAEGLSIAGIDEKDRTSEQKARANELNHIWEWILSVRTASDALEARDTIPQDYADDKHWPPFYEPM